MASASLVAHWAGMSEDDITKRWDSDRRGRFTEIIENEEKRVVASIYDGIQKRAEAGEMDAVEWMESRGLLERADSRIVRKIYAGVAKRAENGELDAVAWLVTHGFVTLG